MAPAAEPRPDLVLRCAPFLPEGEEIQQVLVCQSAPHYAYFLLTYLTGLTMLVNSYRCVAVTGNAIYVLESTKLSGGAVPRRLVARLPRSTRIGPVSGRWARIQLLSRPHWVHHRFFAQIALADAALPAVRRASASDET